MKPKKTFMDDYLNDSKIGDEILTIIITAVGMRCLMVMYVIMNFPMWIVGRLYKWLVKP